LKIRHGQIATAFQRLGVERITIGDLCDLVLDDYEHAKRRNLRDVKWRADKNVRPALGTTKASEFGACEVKRYVATVVPRAQRTDNQSRLSIVRKASRSRSKTIRAGCGAHTYQNWMRQRSEGFLEHGPYLICVRNYATSKGLLSSAITLAIAR